MKDKWLDDIKDRLSDYEMEAPEGLWESIGNPANRSRSNSKRPIVALWRRVAIAATITGVVLICGWQFTRLSDNDENFHTEEYAKVAENPQSLSLEGIVKAKEGKKGNDQAMKGEKATVGNKEAKVEEKATVGNVETEEGNDEAIEENESSDNVDEKNISIFKGDGDDYVSKTPFRNKDKKIAKSQTQDSFSLGVVTTAGAFGISGMGDTPAFGISGLPSDDYWNSANPEDPEDPDNSGDKDNTQDPEDKDNTDVDKNQENGNATRRHIPTRSSTVGDRYLPDENLDEITHHMPMKIGVTFMYRFNKTLGIETGLQYANLKSDIKYGTGNTMFREARQTLHYLGIPVNLKYTPLNWKRLSVYLSGGLTFEKCVYGNVKGMLRSGKSTESVKITERSFQISANAAAGVQFALMDYLGIYAEPGVGYYFDDGSSLCTIYKDKPWNFNINVGVRFSVGK